MNVDISNMKKHKYIFWLLYELLVTLITYISAYIILTFYFVTKSNIY